MNVMLLGSGGREHALAWKIKQSPLLENLYCVPGNPGTAELAQNIEIALNDFDALAQFAIEHNIELTVVGPEVPLVNGIWDYFNLRGLALFGPSRKAAQLEGSKEFSKNFLLEHNIPTASFKTFKNPHKAVEYIKQCERFPLVLKADGLAAGKGVLICENQADALRGVEIIMTDKSFGPAGDTLIIEQFINGDELSVFALCDGQNYLLLPPAQDHKKIGEGDSGKNTGGMGAYAPAPLGSPDVLKTIGKTIIRPTLDAMAKMGAPYRGLLYVGCIFNENTPYVLEFNCRFGDPETQAVLPLLREDLLPLLYACATGSLSGQKATTKKAYSFDVVLTSAGYPGAYKKGLPINGLNNIDSEILVFHSGTKKRMGKLMTNGGRVLNIVSCADSFPASARKVYQAIAKIHFDGMYFRRDIGHKVLEKN